MIGELSPWHWAVVVLLAVLLFGGQRLPDVARGLGRSIRILKAELTTLHEPSADGQRSADESAPQRRDPEQAN
jgi:sec-independent protein translocase protein TatA